MRRCPVVTCEHGGNHVPPAYRSLFRGRARLLRGHRGYDPGALDVAQNLARSLDCSLDASTVTRLLVELNRSLGHRKLFSEVTRDLDADAKAEILRRFYRPHRERVEARVTRLISGGCEVVHVASHSFTPVLDGAVRTADVAWLYDPARPREKSFCREWRDELRARRPELRLRFNYPYRGSDDGLTAHLRGRFSSSRYLGIELEVNQKWVSGSRREWLQLKRSLGESLIAALEKGRGEDV